MTRKITSAPPHPLTQQGPRAQEQGRALMLQSALFLENKQLLTLHLSWGPRLQCRLSNYPALSKLGCEEPEQVTHCPGGQVAAQGNCQDVGGIHPSVKNIWNFQSAGPALRPDGTQTGLFLNQNLDCSKVLKAFPQTIIKEG